MLYLAILGGSPSVRTGAELTWSILQCGCSPFSGRWTTGQLGRSNPGRCRTRCPPHWGVAVCCHLWPRCRELAGPPSWSAGRYGFAEMLDVLSGSRAEVRKSALSEQGASPEWAMSRPSKETAKPELPYTLPEAGTEDWGGGRGVTGCRLGSLAWSPLIPGNSANLPAFAWLALFKVKGKIPVHSRWVM